MIKRRLLLNVFTLWMISAIWAQTVSVSAPSQVAQGENFRISYIVNTKDVDDFRIGDIPNGLEMIAGPYTSTQENYQTINGHTSSSSSITFTYTLYADRQGTFNIPSAKAHVSGRWIGSRAFKIKVSGKASNTGNGAPQMHEDNNGFQPSRATSLSSKDLFINVTASKQRVYEQEPILLTYKIYSTVSLSDLQGKMPDLNGFHTQEITAQGQKNMKMERINGKNYQTVVGGQYILYPQNTGTLKIPSITYKGVVVFRNDNIDPLEAFFNGGSGLTEVQKDIVAKGLNIEVMPLPARPTNFSGGVGHFDISAQSNKKSVKAGETVNIRVVISGTGNLKLIKKPTILFPKNWDAYDAKLTDKTKLTTRGNEGNMIYDYLAVPRNQGSYTIPPIELVYFDLNTKKYQTIKTQPITINVEKGSGTTNQVETFEDANQKDILTIKKGEATYLQKDSIFFGSVPYGILLVFLIILFVLLYITMRKRTKLQNNIWLEKGAKANKQALKRLAKAEQLLKVGDQNSFYEEVLKALWGYIGDKLSMPQSNLSKDSVQQQLSQKGIDRDIVDTFISAIDECEMRRYAPIESDDDRQQTFNNAKTAIMRIEESLKNTKSKKLFSIFLMVCILSFPLLGAAQTKANADKEYLQGNYQQAIADYNLLLKKGTSAELYYNLGNAYFKTEELSKAILAYERASLLAPQDKQIRQNLAFARNKTIDKIIPQEEGIFSTIYHVLVRSMSLSQWTVVNISAFIILLLSLCCYLFVEKLSIRKIGFGITLIMGILFVFSFAAAYNQKEALTSHNSAIVVAASTGVKSTPTKNSKNDFVIHEGTKVHITDRSFSSWLGIRLDDGREGWIMTSDIEEI